MRVAALSLVLTVAGCAPPAGTPGAAATVAVAAPGVGELFRADRAFAADSRRRGADAWAAAWASNGRLERPTGSVIGPDSVRAAIAASLGPVLPRFTWEPADGGMWWDDAGWTAGRWWLTDEGGAPSDSGRYFTAWIRQGESWKVALDLNVPPCAGIDAARDFDFWIGTWSVSQRISSGDGGWEEFPARSIVRLANDGCTVVEHWSGTVRFFWEAMTEPASLRAGSVRLYDPASSIWRIYWIDDRGRAFASPFAGAFDGDTGSFFRGNGEQRLRITFERAAPGRVEWREAIERGGRWIPIWQMDFAQGR